MLIGRPPVPLKIRFWEKVRVVDDDNSCWEWVYMKDKGGYGKIWVNETMRAATAHRVSWFLDTGKWPTQCVLHSCDNPPCVRPSHLWLGTKQENNADRVRKGRSATNINPQRGEKNGMSKLNRVQVAEIRRKYAEGHMQINIAEEYNMTQGAISAVVLGKLWPDSYRSYQIDNKENAGE